MTNIRNGAHRASGDGQLRGVDAAARLSIVTRIEDATDAQ
jgi:hypothetical protein